MLSNDDALLTWGCCVAAQADARRHMHVYQLHTEAACTDDAAVVTCMSSMLHDE